MQKVINYCICFSILIALTGCADLDVKNIKIAISETSIFTEDFTVKVTADVTNNGSDGDFKVTVNLSCSEGEWEKSRSYYIRKNTTQKVEFTFKEPSIATLASDYSAIVEAGLW